MGENKHYNIYLSDDWDGKHGIVTVRPPLPRADVYAAKNKLRTEISLLRNEDDSGWTGVSAVAETRFMKTGAQPSALPLAGAVVFEFMKNEGYDVTFNQSQEVVRTEKGFYPLNAA